MGSLIMSIRSRFEALALQRSARVCYVAAMTALATFIYSFVVVPPSALDAYTRGLQDEHFAFVTGARWWCFVGAVVLIAMGLYSVHRANALGKKKFDA